MRMLHASKVMKSHISRRYASTASVWKALDQQYTKMCYVEKYQGRTFGIEKQSFEHLKSKFRQIDSASWLKSNGLEKRWTEIDQKQLPSEYVNITSRNQIQKQFSGLLEKERGVHLHHLRAKRQRMKEKSREAEAKIEENMDAYIENPEAKRINSKFYLQKKYIRNTLRPHVYKII